MNFLQLMTVSFALSFFIFLSSASAMADDFADIAAAGIKLYEDGKYKDALQKLKKAKRLFPQNNKIDYNIGNINYQLGNFEKARKNWQDAIIKVNEPKLQQKAYYNMANAFYREEKYQKAIQYYQKALQINKKDYETEFNLKIALHQFKLQKKKQDQKKLKSENDILEQRKKISKKNPNESKKGIKQAKTLNSKNFQGKEEKDSYREKLPLNEAKHYLKTLKEGKCTYRSMFDEGSTNRRCSAQNDW